MINAKDELLKIVDKDDILAASVIYKDGAELKKVTLSVGGNVDEFLAQLDFQYENKSDGWQNLHGNVWLRNGTWLDRAEGNASEWWEHRVCPAIPDYLK